MRSLAHRIPALPLGTRAARSPRRIALADDDHFTPPHVIKHAGERNLRIVDVVAEMLCMEAGVSPPKRPYLVHAA